MGVGSNISGYLCEYLKESLVSLRAGMSQAHLRERVMVVEAICGNARD